MASQKIIIVLLALKVCVTAVTFAPTSTHYLNSTISTTRTTVTITSTKVDPSSLPSDFITDPEEGLPSDVVDIGQETSSPTSTHIFGGGPIPSISDPVSVIKPTSTSGPGQVDPSGDNGPSFDPNQGPDPPSPSDTPNFSDPNQPVDTIRPPESDTSFDPGMDDGGSEGDGGKVNTDLGSSSTLDDTPGTMADPLDGSTPAFFEDDTGGIVEVGGDLEPETIVDENGVTISVPPFDATDPLDGDPPIIVSNPQPGQISSATHTLPGRVTTLSSGLGVVLPGSTIVPLDPFLPSLTGSITVISSQTFVVVANPTTVPLTVPRPASTPSLTASVPGRLTSISGTLEVVLPGSTTIPVNSYLPGLEGSTTVISGSTFVILSQPTTVAVSLPKPTKHLTSPLPGRTTLISGTLNVVLPGSTTVPVNDRLTGLVGVTTIIGSETFVIIANPTTVPVNVVTANPERPTGAPGDVEPTAPIGGEPESSGLKVRIKKWDVMVSVFGMVFVLAMY